METELTQLKSKDVKPLREKLHLEQDCICPICGEEAEYSDVALDHQHKLFKDQEMGEDGAGLVRGAICKTCNSWEGKIFNSFRRLGLHKKDASLPELLRGLADYLDRENLPFIHPSEKPKKPRVSKRQYNRLKKLHKDSPKRSRMPEYPKSGKLTKPLEKLFLEFDLSPFL